MNHTEYYRNYRHKKDGKPAYTTDDMEECLICGKLFVFLGSHIRQTHKILMANYKREFGLDRKRGRTCGQFRKIKAEAVRKNGTIKNLELGAKYRFKVGDKKLGKYTRSKETLKRLSRQKGGEEK